MNGTCRELFTGPAFSLQQDGGTAGRTQAIDQSYLDNLRYLRADAGGATVIYAGERGSGDRTYDVLAVPPPNGSERNRTRSHSGARPIEPCGEWLYLRTEISSLSMAEIVRNRIHATLAVSFTFNF